MSAPSSDPAGGRKTGELRLDCLIGRKVFTKDNRPVGRLEEVHVEMRGKGCVITEYVLGVAGLSERLGVSVRLLFGRRSSGFRCRWDQIDLTDPGHPRLTCPIEELRKG